jgi:hypothetical protein
MQIKSPTVLMSMTGSLEIELRMSCQYISFPKQRICFELWYLAMYAKMCYVCGRSQRDRMGWCGLD